MPTRKRELRPDPNGRYRPYVGWKMGEQGGRRQHRFNLGTDRKEAERRLARIRDLYDDNCRVVGEDLWSPAALSYAERIARGEVAFRYSIPFDPEVMDDPALD